MRVSLLDYELPAGSIASRPLPDRDGARMLVLDPRATELEDRVVRDLPGLVPRGALVVFNDTRVLAARLLGHKAATGGKVEALLVQQTDGDTWTALARGLGPVREGTLCVFDGGLAAEVVGRIGEGGLVSLRLFAENGRSVQEAIDTHGQVPLPPYVRRRPDDEDRTRYQTVFARVPGAIAAPTAGLHFTPALLGALRERAEVSWLTLHVGLGTFQPVKNADLDQHPMHAENFEVTPELASLVARARARGGPVVAVGTTVVRALETAADPDRRGRIKAMSGSTRLLIQPGYDFRVVDGLLTNFHLPRSTLLALVAAFAGRDRVLHAYGEAIGRGYRFYSYGDALWIPARGDAGGT